jgi:uncharacterized protein YdeI (BOF family)
MSIMRNSILTVACVGLLSTAAMGMPDEGKKGEMEGNQANPTDPVGHESSAPKNPNTGESMTSGATTHESQSISGEILSVKDEMYVVKDATGKEVNLHVDESTEKSGSPKKGDRIEAEINSDGHALSLKKAEKESAH